MNLVRYQWKDGELPGIQYDQEEIQKRDALVLRAEQIMAVTTADEQAMAVAVGQDLRNWVKDIEAARVEVKAPFRERAELVDSLAKGAVAPLKAELDRLSRLVSCFQAQEAERVRLAEDARQKEIARLEAERKKAEDDARVMQAAMVSDKDLEEAIAAEAAAKKAQEDAYNRIAAPLPEAQKATGAATRKEMCYEVLDVHALYRARPELVRLEANAAAIRATVVVGMVVPGLRIWEETKTVISTRRPAWVR
jgi:hypothetical protein